MRKLIWIFLILTACAPGGEHKPVGESAPELGESSSAGYDSVKPIFARYCAACHPSRSGPDWLDYSQASAYAHNGKLLRRVGQERSMPPPGTPQAAAISDLDRLTLTSWARAGGPKESRAGRGSSGPLAAEPSAQEKLVQSCLHCHGATGPDPSAQPRIPLLSGLSEKYLAAQLRDFKWRARIDPTQAMNDVAIDLSENQIQSAAKYFAKRDGDPAAGPDRLSGAERASFDRGRKRAARDCVSCHANPELGGRPSGEEVPALRGQSKIYLINQLVYFRGDERSNPLMREFARELSNDDIEALAVYFANAR